MLTRITIRNFKRFREADIELGSAVVFVGPNNSGKTTALQSLALWDLGVRRLVERYGDKEPPEKRPGVTINRKDLVALPVPNATLLWRAAHAFEKTQRVRIDIIVEGVTEDVPWTCGLEFDYDNEESLSCRPLRLSDDKFPKRMAVPPAVRGVRLAFLPPMSGLVSNETKLEPGAVAVRIGEGRTAEVLRNLCFRIFSEDQPGWERLRQRIETLFGALLDDPQYLAQRGEVAMTYSEYGVHLDLSSSGRGLQQTLLLLAYLQANPGAILLLDEPDAHLEILRQRQIYEVLTYIGRESGSQIIAASHSEVLLNEAADRDMVVAFVGKPHRIDDRGSQVLKALREIGFEHYYLAERTGWVLYLEGSTDLAILREFARLLDHPATDILERPFVHYVGNQIHKAREHFHGIREAKADLVGIAILDRDVPVNTSTQALRELAWTRREIENYLAYPEVLYAYAEESGAAAAPGPLFSRTEASRRRKVMEEVVRDLVPPAALRDPTFRWWKDTKASDDFLTPVFETFFAKLGLPNLMRKTDFHVLARFVPRGLIDREVEEKLTAIAGVAGAAKPVRDPDTDPPR